MKNQNTTDEAESSAEAKSPGSQKDNKEEQRLIRLLQILYVAFYASQGCLTPFLPVYYDSLGHGGAVIGLIGSINPFTTFIVAPLWGILSDRSQRPFAVLYTTILLSVVGHILLALRSDQTYIMVVVFLSAIFSAPIKPLIDSMAMGHLPTGNRSEYGKLRVCGMLGYGGATSLAGWFLNDSSTMKSAFVGSKLPEFLILFIDNLQVTLEQWGLTGSWNMIFLIHTILHIPALICLRILQNIQNMEGNNQQDHDFKKSPNQSDNTPTARDEDKKNQPPARIIDVLGTLVRNKEAMMVFLLVFIMGISAAAGDNFVYIRMKEVGVTGSEMGFSRLVSSISGAPIFYLSGMIKETLGVGRVFILSFFLYAIRFFLYTIMTRALHGYFAEGLRGPIYAAFWSSSTFYVSSIAPAGLRATMVSDLIENRIQV
jgi:MFS family permease